MADDPAAPAAPEFQPAPQATTDERLGRIETAVEKITTVLEKVIPGSHAEAQQRTEQRLDQPGSIAEEVRRELALAEKQRKAQADKDNQKSEAEQIKADLAALKEKPPRQPVRRATRIMWGEQ